MTPVTAVAAELPAVFRDLEPSAVWRHFATLCQIPRASKVEAALRAHLYDWARAAGLTPSIDAAGNLLIRKAASRGHDEAPGVILQAHLDMVCQKNGRSAHDFARDAIHPVVRDGWLLAEETTLGADNGIGVALILAVLADRQLPHGPIEALLTIDEEAGMGGARGLAPDLLQGRLLLNLDTEEWGEFYLGCAGGIDVDVSRPGTPSALPEGTEGWRIRLEGLRGGHSGVDIHEQRGNAIKLLTRVLCALDKAIPLRLASLRGGSARNALPREAHATLALPTGSEARLQRHLSDWQSRLRRELAGVDDGVRLEWERCTLAAVAESDAPGAVLAPAEQAVWLASLHAAPYGVRHMSRQLPGVVETSNNLGQVELTPAGGRANFMVRSLHEAGSQALADEIASLFALTGTPVTQSGAYPGWTPNPHSPLLAQCQRVYAQEFGQEARVQVIHAGLECGIIGAAYPGLDMVSFGPTIRGAHAPGERVDIASVALTWRLLTQILAALAERPAQPAASR
ncbi:aminoacyl-histidine dipeptidase [Rhodocyclus tenuis]|uniref:Aminoacyl-histidine dipeptidase n=1 Tax=Rhodocyclus gracilis TaxID=2929842 RepID=A0ABX0WHE1_9RHOO|nr:aminoacyl-histidine dipeptidase [Rhodocyclus gracilis]NJA87843.1 aminoacyl-histidine dipeptidase [Rhodocyclus gracilis]